MNKTDLMKDLYKVLKESGWLDKATEHFREHPEYYSKSRYNYIASLDMTLSFQPHTLREVTEVNPNVIIGLYNGDIWNRLAIYSNGYKKIDTKVLNGDRLETVTEERLYDI